MKLITRTLVLLAGASIAMPAVAQDVFEEIVVRAQKREQNIMEVPISVTAVTGAQIEASGIRDMFELQQNVPGLIVGQSQTATTSNFAIRGIGSTANNFGVESSVGLYVDGVYRSRQSSMINDLVDVESVEVLRGPQGTLFGKNTPAGAIQIQTVAPNTDSIDAFFELSAGDLGFARVSAATNIPLSDTMAFRGTIFASERDGYVDDDNFGSDFHNDRSRLGVRLQLGWEPSDTFNMRVIADYSEIDETCCVAVSRVDGLYSRASLTGVPVNGSDAVFLGLGADGIHRLPLPATVPGRARTAAGPCHNGRRIRRVPRAYNDVPVSQNEDRGISVEFNKDFSNGMTLTSISALRAFDTFDFIDGDFSGADIFQRTNDSTQESFSQEFRLSGEFGDGGNWVAGAYYFGQEVTNMTSTTAGTVFNDYVLATNPDLAALVAGLDAVVAGSGGLLPPRSGPYSASAFALNDFVQDQDGYAVFGQFDFPIGDKLLFTLGARYTDETKKVNGVFTDSSTGPPPDLVAIQTALVLASMGQPFNPLDLLPALRAEPGLGQLPAGRTGAASGR